MNMWQKKGDMRERGRERWSHLRAAWDAISSDFWPLFAKKSIVWLACFEAKGSIIPRVMMARPTMMCLEQSRFPGSWLVKIQRGTWQKSSSSSSSFIGPESAAAPAAASFFFVRKIKRIVPLTTMGAFHILHREIPLLRQLINGGWSIWFCICTRCWWCSTS